MSGSRAAIRYAKAVLSLAIDQKSTDAVQSDMRTITDTIAESTDLSQMLQSPVVKASDKKAVLTHVFTNTNAVTVNLIDTLIANKRLAILNDVAVSYTHLYDEMKGMQVATVTTAVALSDDLKSKVLAKVKELTGKEAEVTNVIDESIIGGFVLRVGDIQYNASIANKLNNLKREFTLN
ncbi:ATP synthase F1 subunit delta [Winogradskyella arenosi]|uniref:ATP synthase subunit delta n=1 Tax=Winogradskyella arenosi TaxID=533325 RepID=A0A368ZIG0_9FLAO|nr:ATP synthase F1 subunit delta [Winogradskyella arenosi]RCW93534.1 ATP synthase F1 subcomplex delta subunit [Winogradskyella arenosi]